MNESRADERDVPEGRRVLDESDRPTAGRMRASGSADDGYVAEEDGAAEMDGQIERCATGGGPGLRATEFDIALLPPY